MIGLPARRAPKSRQLASTTTVKFISPTFYKPGGFAFNVQEGQYLQVFQKHTASELSGFFDSEFWTRSVLQECHSEASIRHAVVALGALYKTLEKASESPPGSPDNNPFDTAANHYNFALQQYGKSLTRLLESLQNNARRSQRTVLISIILFTCFQSFIGDHKAAISQIQHGLSLLEERGQELRQPLIRRKDDIVEDEIVQMFTRLAIQAKSYDMAFHFPPPHVIRLLPHTKASTLPTSLPLLLDAESTASIHIPIIFSTSQEARQVLDSLCEQIMLFNELLSSYQPRPHNIIPKDDQSLANSLSKMHLKRQLIQLGQWDNAFQPLLHARHRPGVSNTERAGVNVLKMIHVMTTILVYTASSATEMVFDRFIEHYREMVELAKEVVVDEELFLAREECGDLNSCRHGANTNEMHNQYSPELSPRQPGAYQEASFCHIKASFTLDLGIVAPLFVVATKCRDRKLRREATRWLLSSPRREGMWDSILCGRVAQWIIEIEEEGLSPWDGPHGHAAKETVPAEKRVIVKEILFDFQKREATLRCGTRGVREGDLDMRVRETHIWW